jgi:hypothetical protein
VLAEFGRDLDRCKEHFDGLHARVRTKHAVVEAERPDEVLLVPIQEVGRLTHGVDEPARPVGLDPQVNAGAGRERAARNSAPVVDEPERSVKVQLAR